jgi:uncharacterized protein
MMLKAQEAFSGLLAGLLFGVGLALSGMVDPGAVVGFLDWSGVWNPALIGVLGAAVAVSLVGFQLAPRRLRPWFRPAFPELPNKPIDRPLMVGAVLFGVGWGLAGYCPGPALAGLGLGNGETPVFLAAMVAGGLLQSRWARRGTGNCNEGA